MTTAFPRRPHRVRMGVVPEPRHVDELESFYRQHRLLGAGIVFGGLVGLAASVAVLSVAPVSPPAALLLAGAWVPPILFGLLWRGVGADLMQRRSAARMVAEPEPSTT